MNRQKSKIIIKNDKGEICDYRIPYDINIIEEVENMQKLIDVCEQKIIETTGIPKKIKLSKSN